MVKIIKQGLLYFHTIRKLKPTQIIYRVYYRIRPQQKITNQLKQVVIRKVPPAQIGILNQKKYFTKNNSACFLNHEVSIDSPAIWNDASQEKLWLYNLHYFDALNAADENERDKAYRLLERWVDENPPMIGNGWEPYPTSLRIVNIIKYALFDNTLSKKVADSLYLQADHLSKNLEYHLLGNHLFENAKALCFAGLFFDTDDSRKWFKKGITLLEKQISEQILTDGGHFELSPMYHCIILEGMLDLLSVFNSFSVEAQFHWKNEIEKMLLWLQLMKRSENDIAYFNDASSLIAKSPGQLFAYAESLGFSIVNNLVKDNVSSLNSSGYIVANKSNAKLIMDVGEIGPSYLPGHAHADSLSFELYIDNQPVFVNLGTSCYGISERRQFERSTAAHNTLVMNQENSSEIWAGFRVARRANALLQSIGEKDDAVTVTASHNGYQRLRKGLLHQRVWEFKAGNLTVIDTLNETVSDIDIYFHLHPDCNIVTHEGETIKILLPDGRFVCLSAKGDTTVISSLYTVTFGKLLPTKSIRISLKNSLTNTTDIKWN